LSHQNGNELVGGVDPALRPEGATVSNPRDLCRRSARTRRANARPSHPHSRSSHSHRGRDAERVELDDRIAVRDQRDRAGNDPSAIKRSMRCGIKERMGSPVCWHRPISGNRIPQATNL